MRTFVWFRSRHERSRRWKKGPFKLGRRIPRSLATLWSVSRSLARPAAFFSASAAAASFSACCRAAASASARAAASASALFAASFLALLSALASTARAARCRFSSCMVKAVKSAAVEVASGSIRGRGWELAAS